MQSIRSSEIHPSLEPHFLKMPQTIAGLALLFELIDGSRETVRLDATLRAIEWAPYLKSHASRLYGSVINAALIGARTILDRKEKLPEPFTPREIRGQEMGRPGYHRSSERGTRNLNHVQSRCFLFCSRRERRASIEKVRLAAKLILSAYWSELGRIFV